MPTVTHKTKPGPRGLSMWGIDDHSQPSSLVTGIPDAVRAQQLAEEELLQAWAAHDATERAEFQRYLAAGVTPCINGYSISSDTPRTRSQLDRIEALLQELVDDQRERRLYDELERLTRGWRR